MNARELAVRLRLTLAAAERASPDPAAVLRSALAAVDNATGGALPAVREVAGEIARHQAEERSAWRVERRAARAGSAKAMIRALEVEFPSFAAAWAATGRQGAKRVRAAAEELLPPELRIGGERRCWASSALELRLALWAALWEVFPERVVEASRLERVGAVCG